MSKPATVEEYLAALPEERRAALARVREVILENLPEGYAEGIQYGMIGYGVPHSVYPPGYHCDPKQPLPFAGLASQKNHMSLYLMCVYGSPEHEAWFRKEWAKSGKGLDMGKACVRFKRIEDLPLEVVGRCIARVPVKEFVRHYEEAIRTPPRKRPAKKAVAGGRKGRAKPKARSRARR